MTIGIKIRFAEEKQPYTARACNKRYLICTKPFNPQRTVLYTIVDLQEKTRGPENLVFGLGAETDEECQKMLERISSGQTEISRRREINLRIVEINI